MACRLQRGERSLKPRCGALPRCGARVRIAAMRASLLAGTVIAGLLLPHAAMHAGRAPADDADASTRFAALDELTPARVATLAPAWTMRTGEFAGGQGPNPKGQVEGFQARPVLVGEHLVLTTTTSTVIAVDAETGVEAWRFDPFAGRGRVCDRPHRGVAVWRGAADASATIFSGTCDGRLVSLDAATGTPRARFGDGGVLDLKPGADVREGETYAMTSPPAIYRDLVIAGSLVPEESPRGPAGDVRAFDARTGREVWRFHTVPRPGERFHETWASGAWQRRTGANVWTSMAVDEARGLVFLPVGSASYDFYGGDRPGPNLYANALVALEAATGARRWHAQLVHHDIWDFDPPAQPMLVDIAREGRTIPAVVQLTKMGLVFIFDRVTGEPVFEIEQRAVPQSEVPGEQTSPTQPFPSKPRPLVRVTPVGRDDLARVDGSHAAECLAMLEQVKTSGGIYTPPGVDLTLWFPGTMGGATWSGGAVDPARGLLVVNTNEIGALGRMEAQPPGAPVAYRRVSPWGAYARFWDSRQIPCQRPPWGRLTAVHLASGEIAWDVPLGRAPQLGPDAPLTGTPNLGGAVTTSGGVTFIAATNDRMFRAFETATGRVLWEYELPASGHATPLAYRGPRSGRPFIAIAAGGGGRFSRTVSDTVLAFTTAPDLEYREGGIVRGRRDRKAIALQFTGDRFAEGGHVILDALARHRAKASFHLTGRFLDDPALAPLVRRIVDEGHYAGPHSDGHLLYCPWEGPKVTLVTREAFEADLEANLAKLERHGVPREGVKYWNPPYQWYNDEIARWSRAMGLAVVNFSPGTRSNADYTEDAAPNYVSSDAIAESILRREQDDPHGLNGFLLLLHIGAGPGRTDTFHTRLDALLAELSRRGYAFVRVDEMLGGAR
jgi:glucose dehydrogenase/peptidoglycan/xylan/chitin deacetylase (PgdA/CDA1 family)